MNEIQRSRLKVPICNGTGKLDRNNFLRVLTLILALILATFFCPLFCKVNESQYHDIQIIFKWIMQVLSKLHQTLTSSDIDVQSQSVHMVYIMHPCLSRRVTPITCFMYHGLDKNIQPDLNVAEKTRISKRQPNPIGNEATRQVAGLLKKKTHKY